MENPEGKTICPECNLYKDIFVTGICLDCFKKKQGEEQEENPLDKYTFEEDEYEKLENDFIEKDNREKNPKKQIIIILSCESMIQFKKQVEEKLIFQL